MLHPTVPPGFCLAFFKGTRPGLDGWANRVGRYLDCGPYSHVEGVFSDGLSASSSWTDKGVRFKAIGYSSVGDWDFLPLSTAPAGYEQRARAWFQEHDGQGYDVWGNLRFATNFARDEENKWFCSEAWMASLGFPDPYRFGPSGMASALKHYFNTEIIEVAA